MSKEKFTKYEATFYKGDLPEGGATDWWTEEQWKDHCEYVEELKRTGELGKPVNVTFHMIANPMFDIPKSDKPAFTNFALLIPSGDPNNFKVIKGKE